MPPEDDDADPGSTIVRRGKAAIRFTEMGQFVRDLEARPLERLVADLPGLLALPESKYGLVTLVLAKRMRQSPADRTAVEAELRSLLGTAGPEVKARCQGLLQPLA